MPDYQITAPDGNTYTVPGPPNASREDIIAHVTAKYPQAAKPKAAGGPKALGLGEAIGTFAKGMFDAAPGAAIASKAAAVQTVPTFRQLEGKAAGDIATGLGSPKEMAREIYHTVSDSAADTLNAVQDLGNWMEDKTGYYGLQVDSKGVHLSTKQQEAKDPIDHLDTLVQSALKSQKVIREPQTVTGGLLKDFSEFSVGMLASGRVFGIANDTLKGAASAWTVFDPQQEKLSDLMVKYPWLRNPVTEWLRSKPGDSPMKGRLKNLIEGVVTGKVAEQFLRSLEVLQNAMKGKAEAQAFEVATADKPHFKYVGVDPKTGKPKVKLITPPEKQGEQEAKIEMATQAAAGKRPDLNEGIAGSTAEVATETKGPPPKTPGMSLEQAFSPVPLAEKAKGKLQEWWRTTLEFFAPEALSGQARQAGADIAAIVTESQRHIEQNSEHAVLRKEYFEVNPKKVPDFVRNFEQGTPMKEPALERARQFYKTWMSDVEKREKSKGIIYDPTHHYLPHLFEDQVGVEAWLHSQGVKNPSFTKQRTFDLYEQAAKAGFRPRFTNPEDIFQARQHASDLAVARIDALKVLKEDGLAYEGEAGRPGFTTHYLSPDGKTYWVHDDAKLLINRMFDDKGMWSERNLLGSTYRGLMTLKNNIIPIRLAFSAYHPLHVLTMHMLAATLTRSWKAGEWIPSHYREGSRVLQVMRGLVPKEQLTEHDRQAIQYFNEGGLTLEQDPRYRTEAQQKLRIAFQKSSPTALLHLHTGALQALQDVVFKTWIPSLKASSYLADVKAAMIAKPDLLNDAAARRVALRRLAKSVENRYGEMNYNSLFWDRTFRDISVLAATSAGWQLGMFREYGGGAGQLARALLKFGKSTATDPNSIREVYKDMKRSGDLDKLVYVMNYTTITATLGGLITWATTGKPAREVMDFFAPKSGETNPDGTPVRLRTMFFHYEFAAMAKRLQNQGLTEAVKDWFESKGSGIPSMLAETWTGVNSLGQQIRDPNGTPLEKARQTVNALLEQSKPISFQQRGGQPESDKQKALNVLGFTRAPKYLQETSGEAQIEDLWQRQYKTAETPFQASVKSAERQKLQAAVQSGDDAAVDKILPDMVEKFGLRSQDAKRIMKDASLGLTSYQALFREMKADDQRNILKKMKPEERAKYLQYAKRQIQAEFSE